MTGSEKVLVATLEHRMRGGSILNRLFFWLDAVR
jgi:hypothetical protein